MSNVILLQSTSSSVTVYLELSSGGPATGLIFSDVVVDLKKEGEGTFTLKTLTAPDFVEIGGGTYSISLTTTETNTLGNMYIRVTGSTIKTILVSAYIATTVPVNPPSSLTIPTTVIFGYVVDIDGAPLKGAGVSARTLATPATGTTSGEGYVHGTGLNTAKTDQTGFFTIDLVTGAEVDFFISAAAYRRTFRVPTSSQNIFDIS